MKTIRHTFAIIFIAISTLIVISCARNPVTGNKELMLMSESQEKQIGAEADPSIIQAYGLYDDQELQNFIQRKGEAMAAISHRPELDYTFRLLDNSVVNAFAVPGGYVYFTRGIMAHFNNEAEFMGVLGHEIGHIAARHSAQQYSKQVVAQLGLIGASIASETFRDFSDAASQGLGLLFLKFGRDDESQSDELGVEYSTKVGYDAHQMADFFKTLERMQEESGQVIPTFLSTHPDPGNRFSKVHELAEDAQANNPSGSYQVNRESYLQMIDGMVYGEDPRQGYTDNHVFYHPELLFKFPYPTGWRLANAPTQVQMAPENGEALIIFTLAQQNTPQAAAQAAVEQFNLKVLDTDQTTINGFPTYIMLSEQVPDAASTQQEAIRLRSHFIQYNDIIYVFHGVSTRTDFSRYDNNFKSTFRNFSRLTEQSRINVSATRLNVRQVKSGGTLRQALLDLGAASADLEELSVINGMILSDRVDTGDLVKTFDKRHNK